MMMEGEAPWVPAGEEDGESVREVLGVAATTRGQDQYNKSHHFHQIIT